ncbi:MAG: WYL domain-containing protein [Gammaproteobacteria bacterium]|nr:WYL domain-containing protein [Gammaproteobacteria bacterium]
MAKTSDQLFRQWTLLQKIPVKPSSKTAAQLMQELNEDGFTVSKRTVERDLNELKVGPFTVASDEKGVGNNPNKWFFERDAKLHMLPAMTMQMAFTLAFAQQVLSDQLPPSVMNPMKAVFLKADETLKSAQGKFKNWEKYVKHVPRTISLKSADIKQDVLSACLEGTLQGLCLSISYRPKSSKKIEYQVNPLGLVYRDAVIYLVCTLWKYDDIKQLALHRMEKVELMKSAKARKPTGFDLDNYISDEGAFQYTSSPAKTLQLELKFSISAAQHLKETPLSDDQAIKDENGFSIVKATVLDSLQLRWWLMGFGEFVEVINPKKLREEFKQTAEKMSKMYS